VAPASFFFASLKGKLNKTKLDLIHCPALLRGRRSCCPNPVDIHIAVEFSIPVGFECSELSLLGRQLFRASLSAVLCPFAITSKHTDRTSRRIGNVTSKRAIWPVKSSSVFLLSLYFCVDPPRLLFVGIARLKGALGKRRHGGRQG